MTIKFHENALKQFSRRFFFKFTNLASEPQKILTHLFMFPEYIVTISWARPCLPPEAQLGHAHHGIVHSPRIHPVLTADMSVALLIELFIVLLSD